MSSCNRTLVYVLAALTAFLAACTPNRSTTLVVDSRSIGRYCLEGVLYLEFDRMLAPAFDHQTGKVKPCPVDAAAATTIGLSEYRRVNP